MLRGVDWRLRVCLEATGNGAILHGNTVAHTKPNRTYNALISTYEKGKQSERALELFEAMQRQGVVPNEFT